jgi:hypothetical protein
VKKGSLEATFFFMMSGYSPKMKGFINLSQQRKDKIKSSNSLLYKEIIMIIKVVSKLANWSSKMYASVET